MKNKKALLKLQDDARANWDAMKDMRDKFTKMIDKDPALEARVNEVDKKVVNKLRNWPADVTACRIATVIEKVFK